RGWSLSRTPFHVPSKLGTSRTRAARAGERTRRSAPARTSTVQHPRRLRFIFCIPLAFIAEELPGPVYLLTRFSCFPPGILCPAEQLLYPPLSPPARRIPCPPFARRGRNHPLRASTPYLRCQRK